MIAGWQPLRKRWWLWLVLGLSTGIAGTLWVSPWLGRVQVDALNVSQHWERNPMVAQHLQDYYAEAGTYYSNTLNAKSDTDFNEIKNSIDEWVTGMGHWIIDNMGNGAYVKLIQIPPSLQRPSVKPDRVDTIVLLMIVRDNLEKLVENPARDKPANAAQAAKPVTSR